MLEILTLLEQRDLPVLPEPWPRVMEKMLAIAALLPSGSWWMPQANLALFGWR